MRDRHFHAKLASVMSLAEMRGFEKGMARQARAGREITKEEAEAMARRKADLEKKGK
jgi:hypothetical protein